MRGRPRLLLLDSIRGRIITVIVVLLAVSASISILNLRRVLQDRVDDEIAVDLRQEMDEFELLAAERSPVSGRPYREDVQQLHDVYFAREVPDEGETLLAFVGDELYRAERDAGAIAVEQLDEAIAHWQTLDEEQAGTLHTSAGEVRYVALPLGPGQADGLFVVANFPDVERSVIDDAVRDQALIQFATIVLASLVALALAGRMLRPLRSLADAAQTITETDLTRRITVAGDDEASTIAAAFNGMLERLEAAFATQRLFLDDASHELRVPLTVIRGNIELLEMVDDAEEREQMVGVVVAEIERMNRIVEDLLLLARSERPGFLEVEAVDVPALLADVHRNAMRLCDREWRLQPVPEITIQADPQRLTQALLQLAQNACQHAGPGTPVTIGAARRGRDVVLWVQDSGPGVDPADRERIFQRNAKGSTRHPGDGLGLGLPIVAAIATAHGGRARLADHPGPGARFEIVVPAPASPAEPSRVLSRS